MDGIPGDPGKLSRIELISLYINGYYDLDAELRSKFQAEFARRGLPLPCMAPRPPAPAPARAAATREAARRSGIDRRCFVSYMLLLYSGTAVFYSWIYLAQRLVKMDFDEGTRHKLIQSAIATFYIVAEILLVESLVKAE